MSPKLPAMTGKDLVRVAQRLGFEFRRQTGSHAIYVRASDQRRVVIPMHAGKTVKPKTMRAIIDDLGITSDELREIF
jgi:predicted RNA binding protein YcfA (HicA-like mRNA interferase family)